MYGPYLSSIDGEQALTPPRRHCLGKPLPYQLADTEQADLEAINLYPCGTIKYYLTCRQPIPDFWVRNLSYTISSAGGPATPLTSMPYPRRQGSS